MTGTCNKVMTLYLSNVRGRKTNTSYPYEMKITCLEDMQKAAQYDHVGAKYKDAKNKRGEIIKAHRGKDDFEQADCLPFDCDNKETDPTKPDIPPESWVTPEVVQAAFPDVPFYAVPSRNHMKAKDGLCARPKWHYYFFLKDVCRSATEWAHMKELVRAYFPAFDEKALDAARFMYGVENAQPVFYDGGTFIDEFIKEKFPQEPEQAQAKANDFSGVIPVGTRNATLSHFAGVVLKKYGDEDGKALEAFREKAAQCEQPLEESELSTIWRSALQFYQSKVKTDAAYMTPKEYAAQEFANSLEPNDYTDLGQAELYAAVYGDRAKFTPATKWLVYNGQVWQESELKAQLLSQELTDRQLEEARKRLAKSRKAYDSAVESGDEEKAKDAKTQLDYDKAFRAYVLGRRKSNKLAATLTEAAPKLEIDVALLDRDPFLLNTPAGTVNLKTGEMQPHDPEDYCTKITACSPSSEGADEYAAFLERITCNDKEYERYLQEESGLALIGKVMREQLDIATGEGGNGKSTLFNAWRYVLGDYAGGIASEVLTTNSRKNKSPEYAELRGKRLIIAAELEEGMRLDTATVKKICSTDPIRGEKKFKKPFDFIPSHTVVLYTNHLPKVGTADNGTWDRLVVMPFNARFRGMQGEILNYGDHLFKHCGGAILQWMIDGAKRVIANNYKIDAPQCVKDAIEEYHDNNNWLENFLDECCEIHPNYTQKSGELYTEYKCFCDRTGDYRRSLVDFKQALTRKGFDTKKTKTGAIVFGLRVKSDFLENPDFPPPLTG